MRQEWEQNESMMSPLLIQGWIAERMTCYNQMYCHVGAQVGDYGLGYCANSLELGCDCLGTIKYFDADMIDSKGE